MPEFGELLFVRVTKGEKVYKKFKLTTPYDISTATEEQTSPTSDSEDTGGVGLEPDGKKILSADYVNGNLELYETPVPYDLSQITRVTDRGSPDAGAPYELMWNRDGSKFFILGAGSIFGYTTGTDYEIGSITLQNSYSHNVGTGSSLAWNDQGTQFWVSDRDTDDIYEHSTGSAFDVSSVTEDQVVNFNSELGGNGSSGITFSRDGTRMILLDFADPGTIYQYDLSTAWDISTASYTNDTLAPGDRSSGMSFYPEPFNTPPRDPTNLNLS